MRVPSLPLHGDSPVDVRISPRSEPELRLRHYCHLHTIDALFGVVWCCVALCGVAWCGVVWCGVERSGVV